MLQGIAYLLTSDARRGMTRKLQSHIHAITIHNRDIMALGLPSVTT